MKHIDATHKTIVDLANNMLNLDAEVKNTEELMEHQEELTNKDLTELEVQQH